MNLLTAFEFVQTFCLMVIAYCLYEIMHIYEKQRTSPPPVKYYKKSPAKKEENVAWAKTPEKKFRAKVYEE